MGLFTKWLLFSSEKCILIAKYIADIFNINDILIMRQTKKKIDLIEEIKP